LSTPRGSLILREGGRKGEREDDEMKKQEEEKVGGFGKGRKVTGCRETGLTPSKKDLYKDWNITRIDCHVKIDVEALILQHCERVITCSNNPPPLTQKC
jgi:hypothetical protein